VNPVEIWEGIDTQEETGRNRLTRLAIHILSVVANSAGCERAFSHMGLVHTGICSKLRIEKVRKATIVGMDIKRIHIEAGLLHARDKRNFTSQHECDRESEMTPDHPADISNSDDLDFDQLSEQLIAGAASANVDRDIGDNDDNLNDKPPPLRITIPPLNSATLSAHDSHRATPVRKIPLKILFKYPAATDLSLDESESGMNSFWRGGIQNLDKEMEAYELLVSLSEENASVDVINSEIPTSMH
jgi:hypothetical protein